MRRSSSRRSKTRKPIIGLALQSQDRGEREIMEEIAEFQIKIAERLEILAAS